MLGATDIIKISTSVSNIMNECFVTEPRLDKSPFNGFPGVGPMGGVGAAPGTIGHMAAAQFMLGHPAAQVQLYK